MPDVNIKKAIELAVKTEADGAAFYETMASRSQDNQELCDIFTRLAKDEKGHEAQFSKLLNQIPEDITVPEDSEQLLLLQATGASEFFKQDILKDISGISPQDALIKALNFEKASLLHYHAIKEAIGSEDDKIQSLIDAEKKHVATLMKVVISDAKFRGMGDAQA